MHLPSGARKPIPPFGYWVGRRIRIVGAFSSFLTVAGSLNGCLKSSSNTTVFADETALWMMTVVVPAASNTIAPATIAVFAFVHAIIFNAPLMRVKVEVEAAASLAIATAVTDFASATGAA